jgi:exodeoxyribonuclease VII large subunit
MTEKTLFDPPAPGANLPEFGVAELSALLKRRIEEDFGHVRVKGEITQPKLHSSGHLYLTLKDENAVLSAVCWRGQVSKLKVKPAEGMEVVATGRLTTYPGRSQYQMVIEQMALAGVGALLKMLEDRRRKLAAEGLFDAARKRKLPFMPKVIGVITSPTGAVIRDILHRLEERFPVRVLLWPVAVQGDNAAVQIANAIAGFNALDENSAVPRPDVLIVARGGGSLEDMLPFYEEVVVRAAANSAIPLISAVGHETDTTMIDFASDKRAPTPTAAAEMAVPVRRDLLAQLADYDGRLAGAMRGLGEKRRMALHHTGARLIHPRAMIETLAQKLDDRWSRAGSALKTLFAGRARLLSRVSAELSPAALKGNIRNAAQKLEHLGQRKHMLLARLIERAGQRIKQASGLLESYSYTNVLKRGFALVKDAGGQTVTRAADVTAGAGLEIVFQDGSRKVWGE